MASARGWRKPAIAVAVLIVMTSIAYWYDELPLAHAPSVPAVPGDSLALPLSPDLYGSPSRAVSVSGVGEGRMVEPESGPSALAVLIARDSLDRIALAGIQALLERSGIASVVTGQPIDTAATRQLLNWMELERIRRGRPVRLVVQGAELDLFLERGGSEGGRDLVVYGAPPPSTSRIAAALARLPERIRPAPDTIDVRLVGWDLAVVVVAHGAPSVAWQLARGARRGVVFEVAREEILPIPAHPDQERWRDVLQLLAGVTVEQPEVVVGAITDSVVVLPPID